MKKSQKKIYLSFDIEEFDMPKEYGYEIDFQRQISISRKRTEIILDLLKKYNAKATFFSTAVFAREVPDLIQRLISEGHELASHTFYHSEFELEDLKKSKEFLEENFGVEVFGLRMPRLADVPADAVLEAGYWYNSSINPTFLPGRYNHLNVSKTIFYEGKLLQIPVAVSPLFRVPLFWLAFHNFPLGLYYFLLKRTLKYRRYATLYFHPWEFTDLHQKEFNFPSYVMKNTGKKMVNRFENLLKFVEKNHFEFGLYREFLGEKR